jgi:hypothetical protein
MHGLLIPETPSLAALRGRISELGAGPLLIDLARQVMRPPSVAFAIATCLDAAYLGLYKSLSGLVAAGPPLLQHAGDDEHEPERYMEIWLSSIREIGNQGQANGRP